MDAIRNGRFTASEIYRLMKPGRSKGSFSVDSETYIEECNRERRLMRSVDVESDARPLSWGKAIEKRAFDLLPTDYTLCSDVTIQHPEIDFFVGSPDAVTEDAVIDLKCPLTLSSFCQMVDPYYDKDTDTKYDGLTIEALRGNHKDGDKFFWQLVANSILTGKKKAQLICYVPFEDELDEIKLMVEGTPQWYWIWVAEKEKLPYLVRNGAYTNINIISFDIFDRDTNALLSRIKECGEKLIPFHTPKIIE